LPSAAAPTSVGARGFKRRKKRGADKNDRFLWSEGLKVVIDEKERNAGNQEMHANGQQQRTPPRLAILPRGDGNCQGNAQERRYEWGWRGTEDKVAEESPPVNRFGRL